MASRSKHEGDTATRSNPGIRAIGIIALMTDDEVRDVARHAEAMAHLLIALALQDGRIH